MRLKQAQAFFYFFIFCGVLVAQETSVLNLLKPLNQELRSASNVKAYYRLDLKRLLGVYQVGLPEKITWEMPVDGKLCSFQIQKTTLFAPQFKLLNTQNQADLSDLGQHNQYMKRDTLISISIYEDEVIGFFVFKNQNLTLARQANQVDQYVFTESDPISPVSCQVSNQIEPDLIRKMQFLPDQQIGARSQLPPIDLYFELDHYLFLEQDSSIPNSIIFLTGIFNSVQLLYAREGINIRMHSVKVWDRKDGFETQNASSALNSFRNYIQDNYKSPEWDIAVLVSRYSNDISAAPNGGIANLDGLCNNAKRQLYTNISASAEPFPNFSWPVFLISHELGHTFGAAHSHNCNWPGGPLDNCYCPEGNCELGPKVDVSGGTLMSYCYLTNAFSSNCPELPNGTNPGVNFLKGFGKYPGDLIRQNIAEAYCLKNKALDSLPNLEIDTATLFLRVNDSLVIKGLKIRNTGLVDVDTFQISLSNVFIDSITYETALIQLVGLSANDTLSLDTVLYFPLKESSFSWAWTLDPGQEIREWDEGDNHASQQLQGNLQFPQLAFLKSGRITDSTYYFTLDQLELINSGGDTAQDIFIQYFLSTNSYLDDLDFMIGTNQIEDLNKASSSSLNLFVFKPNLLVPAGEYYLIGKLLISNTNIPMDYPHFWIFVLDHKISLPKPRFGWFRN